MFDCLTQLWPQSVITQALVVGSVVGVIAYNLFKKRYNLPPGPKGWPLIGNLREIRGVLLFRQLRAFSRKYGPVMKIKIGTRTAIILSRIDVVTEALITKHADFAGRPDIFSDEVRDFTDALILVQKEAEEDDDPTLMSQMTNTHMVQTIFDLVFAGTDTTRNTLHWCLLAMALHPDIQKKVQKEVDSVIDPDLNVHVSDRDKLPYTDAVVHEVMRMRTVVPVGVPHSTLCDTTVGGYDVPKGTMVFINHDALHFDPDRWEDVNTFKPERFLDSDGKMGPKPESWLPFSAGRRVCLGETVAKPEIHLFFAGILRVFSISLVPGTQNDFEPQSQGLEILLHFAASTYPRNYSRLPTEQILATLYGQAVGDAIGLLTEFLTKREAGVIRRETFGCLLLKK
ncbi:cytochrome P450 2J4-like [Haliotis rubra]|uniref:cytochrome P450 2J4-like n=1 Tax=Haliotis rubra TaxID=36100 RepID=UPI001EE51EAB|nr:cytochrome P450 2J4-like [Haliotis rubra]